MSEPNEKILVDPKLIEGLAMNLDMLRNQVPSATYRRMMPFITKAETILGYTMPNKFEESKYNQQEPNLPGDHHTNWLMVEKKKQ